LKKTRLVRIVKFKFDLDMGFQNIVFEGDFVNMMIVLKLSIDYSSYFSLEINNCKSLSC